MNRTPLVLVVGLALGLASCRDNPTTPAARPGEIPPELLTPQPSIVDGDSGGNEHFFWLPPIGDRTRFDGVADPTLSPVVVICPRNAAGDGCAEDEPVLATFTRTSGIANDLVRVNDDDHYFVNWQMNVYTPERDGVYRIRVLLQDRELGHADVIALGQPQLRLFTADEGDEIVPVSDQGAFRIVVRLEEGVLEQAFCDDPDECETGVEVAGDGEDTNIQVETTTDGGEVVAGAITVSDEAFVDENGEPVEEVIIVVEVKETPPSGDLAEDQQFPFFVEINTFPRVFIDPESDGVLVEVCQDAAVLAERGVDHGAMVELVLFKVTAPTGEFPDGRTERLETNFGTPACSGETEPSPEGAVGFVGMLRSGVSRIAGLFTPQPLVASVARRLHGGLNTVIRNASGSDPAFSTFAATEGPNGDSTFATVPDGAVGVITAIDVQVRTATGDDFTFGDDTVHVVIIGGPSAGEPVSITDDGDGTYTAEYTPVAEGEDTIEISLTTFDGTNLGEIGGSPYTSTIFCTAPNSLTTVTVTPGAECGEEGVVSTAAEAIFAVQDGGTIWFDEGTHEAVRLTVPQNDLTMEAVEGTSPVILSGTGDPEGYDGEAFNFLGTGAHVVRALTFQSPGTGLGGIGIITGPNSIVGAGSFNSFLVDDVDFEGLRIGVAVVPSDQPGALATVRDSRFTGSPIIISRGVMTTSNDNGATATVVEGSNFTGDPGFEFLPVLAVHFGGSGTVGDLPLTVVNNELDTFSQGVLVLGSTRLADGSVVSGNEFQNPTFARRAVNVTAAPGASVTMSDNTMVGAFAGGDASDQANYSYQSGLRLTGEAGSVFQLGPNTISGAYVAIDHFGGGTLTGTDHEIDQVWAPIVSEVPQEVTLRESDITNFETPYSTGPDPFPAGALQCNWWGSSEGPGADPVVTPWAVAPIANDAGGECTGADEGFGTAEIDGVQSPGEWDQAHTFDVFGGDADLSGSTLYVMNDGTTLYLGLYVPDALSSNDLFESRFDNANNSVTDEGDDDLRLDGSGTFTDGHFNGTSWGHPDASAHGSGAAATALESDAFYEIAHPLNSGDGDDFSLSGGDAFGLCVRFWRNGTATSATTFPVDCVLAVNEQASYETIGVWPSS